MKTNIAPIGTSQFKRTEHVANIVFDPFYVERMTKDPIVSAALNINKTPILAAKYGVEVDQESPEHQRSQAFIEHVLFNDLRYKGGIKKSFTNLVNEILSYLDYGYSVFEVVHKQAYHSEFGDYIGIADIAYRSQNSIRQWHTNPATGEVVKLSQAKSDGRTVDLPIEILLIFTHQGLGSDKKGESMLRSAYGAWYRLQQYEAAIFEQASQTAGIPVAKREAPAYNADTIEQQSDDDTLLNSLDSVSNGDASYIVVDNTVELDQFTRDNKITELQKQIEVAKNDIYDAMGCSFIKLTNAGNSGSYALSADLSQQFINNLQRIADYVCETIQPIIDDLITWKYGADAPKPKLIFKGIDEKSKEYQAKTLETLAKAKLITPNQALLEDVAEKFNLPAPEIIEEEVNQEDIAINQQQPPEPEDEQQETPETPETPEDKTQNKDQEQQIKLSAKAYSPESATKQVQVEVTNSLGVVADVLATELVAKVGDKFIEQLVRARANNDNIAKVEPQMAGLVKKLKPLLQAIHNRALAMALDGSGLKVADLSSNKLLGKLKLSIKQRTPKQRLDQRLVAFIAGLVGDLNKLKLADIFDSTDSEAALKQKLGELMADKQQPHKLQLAAANLVGQITAAARNDAFIDAAVIKQIDSYIFMNPSPDSDVCKDLAGRVFSVDEYRASGVLPPLHHNCKSTIVPQWKTIKNKQPISPLGLSLTGTPEQIARNKKQITF
jgi:SPP1 gp7 family putative phage head morphogenesis protein